MKLAQVAVILLAVVQAACAPSQTPTEGASSEDQENAWIAHAQVEVKKSLKDGASAEFRSVTVSRYNGAPLVCGEVNSKNSFGGYGGFQRFIYAGSTLGTVLEENMAAGEMEKSWSEFCRG